LSVAAVGVDKGMGQAAAVARAVCWPGHKVLYLAQIILQQLARLAQAARAAQHPRATAETQFLLPTQPQGAVAPVGQSLLMVMVLVAVRVAAQATE
jgi:hypothetical protein